VHESVTITRRTIWQAKCETCGESKELAEHTKREHFCFNCKVWVPYKEISYTGEDIRWKK
jgi:ribosomal protein S27AE